MSHHRFCRRLRRGLARRSSGGGAKADIVVNIDLTTEEEKPDDATTVAPKENPKNPQKP